jgi:hypothetical protein
MNNSCDFNYDNVLGHSDTLYSLESAEQNLCVALDLVSQAQREVYVLTHDLDPPIFGHKDFVEALSAFARRSRYSEAKFLIRSSDKAVKYGHRIIPLAQRLSSSIFLRTPSDDFQDFVEAFMIVDGVGYIRRKEALRFDAEACFRDRRIVKGMRELFIEMWEQSEPDPKLRRLQL